MPLRKTNPAEKAAMQALTKEVERALARTRGNAMAFTLEKAVSRYRAAMEAAQPLTLRVLEAFDATYAEYQTYVANRKEGEPFFTYSGWLQHVLKTLPDLRNSVAGNVLATERAHVTIVDRTFAMWEVSEGGGRWQLAKSLSDGPDSEFAPDIWRTATLLDGREIGVKFWRKIDAAKHRRSCKRVVLEKPDPACAGCDDSRPIPSRFDADDEAAENRHAS